MIYSVESDELAPDIDMRGIYVERKNTTTLNPNEGLIARLISF